MLMDLHMIVHSINLSSYGTYDVRRKTVEGNRFLCSQSASMVEMDSIMLGCSVVGLFVSQGQTE